MIEEIWLDNLGDTHQDVMNNLVSQTIAEEYKRWDQYHAEKVMSHITKETVMTKLALRY